MKTIIGRKIELDLLQRLYGSSEAEFLAIYGRRRVGKTFLVTEFFKNRGIFFEITGAPNSSMKEQIINFHREYCALFCPENGTPAPKNWSEALYRLIETLEKIPKEQKITLFFDELPWLSKTFLKALDYAWNRHLSRMPNLFLIVCGSAASWMIKEVLNNKGGLYGRLSAHLRLLPFSLSEMEEYLQSRNIHLPRKQLCEVYMVTGGVPKYLSLINQGESSSQIINHLCFTPQSPLLAEFHKLYHSLFEDAEKHVKIVKALAEKRRGLSRLEVIKACGFSASGRITKILTEIEESGFIMSVPKIGQQRRDLHYYLSDEYSLFYLVWIDPVKGTLLQGVEENYWQQRHASQPWKIWSGFTFEGICHKHLSKIKHALGIGSVTTTSGYWKGVEAEVDLVIDRADQCTNLCEIKFYDTPFQMTKKYGEELERKKANFREQTKTKKALFTTFISPFGVKENSPYLDHTLTLDDLFNA